MKSKNGQGVPASRKADEVRLYALRGGATRCCRAKMVRTAHFRSHEVFRGDLIPYSLKNAKLSLDFFDKLKRAGAEPARHFLIRRQWRHRNSEFRIHNSELLNPPFSADFPVRDSSCQFIVSPAAFQPDSVFTAYIVLSAG